MKSNKEKVYDFIRLHAADESCKGVSTSYIAKALGLQRTNVSSILNTLAGERKIHKTGGRPVLYRAGASESKRTDDCFGELIGCDGSLKHAIQLAKAALLYPAGSLNAILEGARGTGKRRLAELMYRYAVSHEILSGNAPFVQMNCRDYAGAEKKAAAELFGEDGNSGLWNRARGGLLYLDSIQYLSGGLRRRLAERIRTEAHEAIAIAGCTEESQIAEEEVLAEFPMVIRLPGLAERPLEERMEMIKHLFIDEAARIGRTLVMNDELLRCLLLYECEANYYQLKADIRIGCANAYVREYQNQDEITLFISDFERRVRQGIVRWGGMRDELRTLVPANSSYSFDGMRMQVRKEGIGNIYEQLSRKVSTLNAEGMSQDDIHMILSAEVERSFGWYHRELMKEVNDREQLAALVDKRIIEMTDDFLRQAEIDLGRRFNDSVFYGLCLHLKSVTAQKGETGLIHRQQFARLLEDHKEEYIMSVKLAERIGKAYGRELPADEIILIAMFLCYEPPALSHAGKPAILFAFYGEGIARAIVDIITGLTHFEHVYSFEFMRAQGWADLYEALKRRIVEIHQGGDVYVVYDGELLPEMLDAIAEEAGILIRQFPAPVTTMGIELARRALAGTNPDKAYQEILQGIRTFSEGYGNYIVTLCTTGKGGAEELKHYLERYGKLETTQIISMSMSDPAALKEAFQKLLRRGTIQCVVGAYDPKLFSVPFCSISQVFGTPKERLPELLRKGKTCKGQLEYPEIFDYLGQQLTHVDLARLRKLLPEVLDGIGRELKELSLDAEAGLLIHLACCVDRLKGGGQMPVNPQKALILAGHEQEFRKLLKLLKPLEKSFHIIISDDEVANILAVIYQL